MTLSILEKTNTTTTINNQQEYRPLAVELCIVSETNRVRCSSTYTANIK